MSTYNDDYDEPRRYRSVRTRPRERGDDTDYIREETYIERGKGPGPRGTELVYRGRDRDDSIEDIPRDFPPPGRDHRRARSAGGRRDYDDYADDRYTDYGVPAAAGAAGYAAGRRRERERRSRRDRGYDSDYSDSPPRRERRKSGIGDILEGLGLGGAAGALLGQKDKDRDRSPDSRGARSVRSRSRGGRSRRHPSDDDDDRSRSRGGDRKMTERKWAQAAQAALIAGAIEAFRSRQTPGPWTGDKGKRIATAAFSAGGIDGLLDRDPEKKTKRHLAEAVIGGLGVNRLANGPRSKSRGRDISPDAGPRSRSRSIIDRFRGRSQSRGRSVSPSQGGGGGGAGGAVKGLVAGGAVAAAGKALYDRFRSKSRKRRSPSRDSSADSYVPNSSRRRDTRRSPGSDTRSIRRTDGATERGLDRGTNGGNQDRAVAAGAGAGAGAAYTASQDKGGADKKGSGSDSSSTTDMENKRKKMRGKELVTAALATVATIHAAHGVYSSMEAHEKRHRLVEEGQMSPEEARKKQSKAWIQDAAAVGIAALGIKGAFSEWKEMNEQRREIHEIEGRKRERRKKRIARIRQEERDRHERMMNIMEKNPQLAMNYQMMTQSGFPGMSGGAGGPNGAAAPAAIDASGNPYA